MKESELTQAIRTANEVQEEAQMALKDIQEARKIAVGEGLPYSKHFMPSQERFMVTH